MRKIVPVTIVAIGFNVLISCGKNEEKINDEIKENTAVQDTLANVSGEHEAVIEFYLRLDTRVYQATRFGEPPQIAIWLENAANSLIRTVWVTHRSAKGDWKGKVECVTSLPYWVSRYNIETKTEGAPDFRNPLPDMITGATPKTELLVKTTVPRNSIWNYYIEVNVSADYNEDFPYMLENGWPDPNGNGQPSLVYQGKIDAAVDSASTPRLIGRTEQYVAVDTLNDDLTGMTSSKKLFQKMVVTCK